MINCKEGPEIEMVYTSSAYLAVALVITVKLIQFEYLQLYMAYIIMYNAADFDLVTKHLQETICYSLIFKE